MLPGTPSRPSFTVTVDFFGGSGVGAGAGAGAGVGAGAAAVGAGGGGGGGGGGAFWAPEPNSACAVQPMTADAATATTAVNIKGATIFRAILLILFFREGSRVAGPWADKWRRMKIGFLPAPLLTNGPNP